MKTLLIMIALCASSYAQKQGLPIPEFGRVAQQLNSAPFIQTGTGAPSAVPCAAVGLDEYFDTSGHVSYICIGASTTAGTWLAIGSGSSSLLSGTLAGIPSTCTVGASLYQATDQPSGLQLYACTTTNTWTRISYSQGGT